MPKTQNLAWFGDCLRGTHASRSVSRYSRAVSRYSRADHDAVYNIAYCLTSLAKKDIALTWQFAALSTFSFNITVAGSAFERTKLASSEVGNIDAKTEPAHTHLFQIELANALAPPVFDIDVS